MWAPDATLFQLRETSTRERPLRITSLLSTVDSTQQLSRNVDIWCPIVARQNRLLNKQSSCQWSEPPWHLCDTTVMTALALDIEND